jgi:hypothetical protein
MYKSFDEDCYSLSTERKAAKKCDIIKWSEADSIERKLLTGAVIVETVWFQLRNIGKVVLSKVLLDGNIDSLCVYTNAGNEKKVTELVSIN